MNSGTNRPCPLRQTVSVYASNNQWSVGANKIAVSDEHAGSRERRARECGARGSSARRS